MFGGGRGPRPPMFGGGRGIPKYGGWGSPGHNLPPMFGGGRGRPTPGRGGGLHIQWEAPGNPSWERKNPNWRDNPRWKDHGSKWRNSLQNRFPHYKHF